MIDVDIDWRDRFNPLEIEGETKSLDMKRVLGIYIFLYTVSKIHTGGDFYG